MTSQKFSARLKQHMNNDVLKQISNTEWEYGFCKKFVVYVKNMDIAAAKFFESTFLAAFNFARNHLENVEKRLELHRYANQVGGTVHFKRVMDAKIKDLSNLGNMLVGWTVKALVKGYIWKKIEETAMREIDLHLNKEKSMRIWVVRWHSCWVTRDPRIVQSFKSQNCTRHLHKCKQCVHLIDSVLSNKADIFDKKSENCGL